jgi:hypothetical protein
MAGRRRGSLLLIVFGCLVGACVMTASPQANAQVETSARMAMPPAGTRMALPADDPPSIDPGGDGDVTTEPPATTAPPTTAPPTQPPTTAPVTTEPPATPETTPAEPTQPVAPVTPVTPTFTIAPDTGSSTSWLPWVLAGLGALILVGLIVLFARSASRRDRAVAAWRSRRLNAYAEGAALHDAVLSTQSGPMQASEAAARWADIQHRADNFNQRLYQLRETAPDEAGRTQVDELLVSLQALRSALDTQRASGLDWTAGAATSLTAGVVRDRLNDFRLLLSGLRDADPSAGR